ncbi:uncharacterized protein CMU_013410 [Cryptosporidium muris RN66]|uniref:Uncharacterized protein n=1 Tax=Cryptosporidium muris (strain RN66) TaxID=441375 RepID=B6AEP9_CRYMR|nr:uncharacterized protein CMU_013410 [Cryptosporidium muris RN66]EEA06666.1 hypothetical protein, conserved [Cryptosporidium muris RN66]|eukprot:XP_002141015.1 hypothetical protein [Cryptosporidium muris RN66]
MYIYVYNKIFILLIFLSGFNYIDSWNIKNVFKKKQHLSKQVRVLEDQAKKSFERPIPNCEDYGMHGCDPTTPDACSECYSRCGRQCEDFLWLSLEAINFRMLPRAESQKECKLYNGKKSTRILCYTTAGRRHVDPTAQILETMSITLPQDIEKEAETNELAFAPEPLHSLENVPYTEAMLKQNKLGGEADVESPQTAVMLRSSQNGQVVSSRDLETNFAGHPALLNISNAEDSTHTLILFICGSIIIICLIGICSIIIYKKKRASRSLYY